MHILKIKNLTVRVGEKTVLKDVNLEISDQEVLALVGPNGHGKSSLLLAIMGNPRYEILEGDILFDDQSILELKTDERARLGLFLAFQNPPEIEGVSNLDFYKTIITNEELKGFTKFYREVTNDLKIVGLPEELVERELNVGFSGGEKKRHELMQMLLLTPKFVLLDEIDSGLDVDAIQMVGELMTEQKKRSGIILISHYNRLFKLVSPTRAVVLMNGRIAYDGTPEVLDIINEGGFGALSQKLNIELENRGEDRPTILLENCAIKKPKTDDQK